MSAPDLSQYLWPDAELGRQPQGPLEIADEWKEFVVGYILPTGDYVNTGCSGVIGEGGLALATDGASSFISKPTEVGAQLSEGVTLLLVASPNPRAGAYERGLCVNTPGGSASAQIQVYDNGSGAGAGIQFGVYRTAAGTNYYTNSVIPTGKRTSGVHVYAAKTDYIDPNGAIFLDGEKLERVGGIGFALSGDLTATTLDLGRLWHTGSPYYGRWAGLYLGVLLRTALPDDKIVALSDDPYQLFKAPLDIGWPALAAGGGLSITATQATATASGANASVNIQQAINASLAVANATGLSASISNTLAISAAPATANATGLDVSVDRKLEIAASLATGVASAFSASINLALNVAAEIAQATASGQSASIATAGVLNISATQATTTALGLTGNVNRQSVIQAVFGAAVADGYSATVDRQLVIASTATNCVASGLTAGIDRQLAIDAIVANCVASGLTAGLSFSGVVEIVASVAQATASGFTASITSGSFSGSLSDADINRIVVAVLAALQATTIPVDLIKVKGQTITGLGTEASPWGP